ncbi:MAG: NAD(P)-dependent oxidoreductase [Desulfobacterales bacterium]
MKKIGIIGTGVMGVTVALKAMADGYGVIAFDSNPKTSDKCRDLGLEMGQNPAEVARNVKIVLLFLPGPAQVIDCVTSGRGLLAALQPGAVIADMSTIDPDTTVRMAAMALEKDVGYLDAPVLGRPATVGKWAIPVGGREEDLTLCRPVFELVAASIYHMGPSGTGHKVKLLNQLMFGAINAMTAEMMAISEKVGIAPKLLYETIAASQAGTVSNLFKELGARIATDDYANPTFSIDLLIKDVRLAVEMAQKSDAPPLVARSVEFLNEAARAQGLGSMDTAAMWKCYRQFWEKTEPDSGEKKKAR